MKEKELCGSFVFVFLVLFHFLTFLFFFAGFFARQVLLLLTLALNVIVLVSFEHEEKFSTRMPKISNDWSVG